MKPIANFSFYSPSYHTRQLKLRFMLLALSVICMSATANTASTQPFLSRPVRVIVQTAAGSSIDVAARMIAEALTRRWGQQVYVLNQPGAGGAIAARALASAPADGTTLLLAASSIFLVLPELQKDLQDSIRTMSLVSFVGDQPMAVAVPGASTARTFADLITQAREASAGLNCAVSTRGGLSHLSGAALGLAAGAPLSFVHYPGTAQALSDVIAERVPVIVDSLSALMGPAASGQIRILAVGSSARLEILPDVPTMSETLPGFDATAWFALVAPAGTPAEVISRMRKEVADTLESVALRSRLADLGTVVRSMSSPEFIAFIGKERARWSPIVRDFGADTIR